MLRTLLQRGRVPSISLLRIKRRVLKINLICIRLDFYYMISENYRSTRYIKSNNTDSSSSTRVSIKLSSLNERIELLEKKFTLTSTIILLLQKTQEHQR